MKASTVNRKSKKEYAEFLSLYGGEEFCKKNFPATYESLQSIPPVTSKTSASSDIQIGLLAAGISKNNPQYIELYADMVRGSTNGYNRLLVNAVQKSTGITICQAENSQFQGNYTMVSLKVPVQYKEDCLIDIYGSSVNETAQVVRVEEDLSNYSLSVALKEFLVYDPIQKEGHPSGDDNIVATYGYFSKIFSDYSYSSYSGNFKLPTSGKITLDSQSDYFNKLETVTLEIKNSSGNLFKHTTPANGVKISGRDLTWNLAEDWGFSVTSAVGYSTDLVYTLSIPCRTALLPNKTNTFIVTNNPQIEATSLVKKIGNIKAYRDCLAGGTLIQLSDGSSVPIENVKVGQSVFTGLSGKSAKIAAVWSGDASEELCRVFTEDGRNVLLSENHQLLTLKGYLQANELETGMEVRMADGGLVKVERVSQEKAKNPMVYNLEFAGENRSMVADGFVVQGISHASMAPMSDDEVRLRLDKKWLVDFDNLRKRKKGEKLWG